MNIKADRLSNKLMEYFSEFKQNKKFILIYFALILLIWLSLMNYGDYASPKFEIFFLILVLILGSFCINYYTRHQNQLYKVAFCIILCFGIVCCLTTPLFDVCDEGEHFYKAEITSHGDFFPVYKDGGFNSIIGAAYLKKDLGLNVFNAPHAFQPINNTNLKVLSSFQQNPFYGYLAPGIGIDIAKILNLDAIWMLWLGRICNLIMYAGLVAIAVKKTPILKIPMIAIACLPIAIYQASSVSIDAFINGIGFIIAAYILYMFKCGEKTLDSKDIAIFSILTLLIAFSKVTYCGFILFLLIIPRNKFKNENNIYLRVIALIVVVVLTLLWTKYYAMPNLMYSFRADYFKDVNANSTLQMQYILNNPGDFLFEMTNIPNYLIEHFYNGFYLGNPILNYTSPVGNILSISLIAILTFLYPTDYKIPKKIKYYTLVIVGILFFGVYIAELLSWNTVGSFSPILGVDTRYFIPIAIFLPFIFSFNHQKENIEKINKYIMVISIILISALIITIITIRY